ncbi:sedoheptulokinase [Paenibacillus sp. HW567]|uniref:sedoheptulokinase n=1 Tax=Paenibacillus sp. HW567 TaxID=1034769 RepID=UPI0003805063|nr:FGGY family carbohydrate kinase [Paenibacillus sp. HW567]
MKMIGIDIGTTSISGLVYDLEQRCVLHVITESNLANLPGSQGEWERLQDPEVIIQSVENVLEQLFIREPEVAGIGLTGQMHGIVYTDQTGKHVSPLFTWQDGRGGLSYDNDSSHTYAQKLSEATGYAVAPGYGLATHFYNMQQNLVPHEAVSMCTIADYAAMRLAGRTTPLMDATQAAGLGCYGFAAGDFDKPALAKAGIHPDMLPQVVPSGTPAGLTSDGLAVYTSIGDNQASFLGSVPFPEEAILLNIGTGSQISVLMADLHSYAGELEARPYPGGGNLLVGAALSGGKSYALLEQFFRQIIEAYTGETQGKLYPLMDTLLQNGTSSSGLTVKPQFLGTRLNPENQGSIEGITPGNFTPGMLTHAFLQGMVDELYAFYRSLCAAESAKPWTRLIGSGNALRANPVLCRKVEERFGLPLLLSTATEEAAVGAALCAAVGAGMIGSFREAGKYLGWR